jgi:carbonic anhydrase
MCPCCPLPQFNFAALCEAPDLARARLDRRRRAFLRVGALAAAAPWAMSGALAAGPAAANAPNAIAPAEALARLMAGNVRYAANQSAQKDFSAGRAARVTVQHPIAAIVSCADSRLAPEFAFDQGPGDLFVARIAGNYASPAVLSSLEYAVAVLGTPLILVLGHTHCGAVSAAVKSIDSQDMLPGTMQDIVNAIQPAVVRARSAGPDKLLDRAIVENVKMQRQILATRPSLVKSMFDDQKIDIVAAVYDLATGKVTRLS